MKRKKGRSRHDGGHREGDAADENAKKAKKATTIPDICDDALLGIFSRLTSRDAARCATLSKRHRNLICSINFWHLHCHLGPPLPRPHVAYMATVATSDNTRRASAAQAPVLPPGSVFLDFHLAGAGGHVAGDDKDELLRYSLIDRRSFYSRYVGTCNGVILMAQHVGASSILLFNPAVARGEEEVELQLPACHLAGSRYRVVGFGYGPSSRLHKLLLTRDELYSPDDPTSRRGIMTYYRAKELFVYTLGSLPASANQQPRLRLVMSKVDAKISATSVYLDDGKIYLLADWSRVLAFDVDDESVTAIDLPDGKPLQRSKKLLEVSGRLCVATGRHAMSLWLLTADQQWVRLGKFWCGGGTAALTGVWDFGGVLLIYSRHQTTKAAYLQLVDTRNVGEHGNATYNKLLVPRPVAPEQGGGGAELVMCWGYKPTLVSPGSIVVVDDAPPGQRSGGGVVAALEPVLERDVRVGREGTMESVCFMNLLLHIMTKLPDEQDDVVKELRRKMLPFSLR